MKFETITIQSDLTIVGAGMPGICGAIQAARLGMTVALINNRGFLGGNASPEIRIDVCGADGSGEFNFYAREAGILEELRLENLYRNPQGNPYLWHTVLMDFILRESKITLYLNTNIDEVATDDNGQISMVAGSQIGTEKRYRFESPLYMDDTGDGTVGYLAGADYRMGREGKAEYNERIAPDEADDKVILSTLSFYSGNTGRPSPFTLPDFARGMNVKDALDYRVIPDKDPESTRFEAYRMQWFYEIGHEHHQIRGAEEIIHDHRKLVWGIWDHLKNSGHYDADTYDITYMSPVPGKRESRRLLGDHVLTENDIVYQTQFPDAIGYGGWSIDLHALEGFFDDDLINRHYILNGVYGIPLRSCYSRNVSNLLISGRCMSTSHVAFGTTRVMATLAVLGQSLGAAASLCRKYETLPKTIAAEHMDELKRLMADGDQGILSNTCDSSNNLALRALLTASSTQAMKLEGISHGQVLDNTLALILPVEDSQETIAIPFKAGKDTELCYQVWTPSLKENYKPQKLLMEATVAINSSSDFQWVTLPLDLNTAAGKLFIQLQPNPDLTVGMSTDRFNGIFTLHTELLPEDSTYCNIETHEILKDFWIQSKDTICFRSLQKDTIYSPENLVNGFSRNYGLPNLWLSEKEDKSWLQVTFDEPQQISTIALTFDSDLDFFYDNLEIYYDFNVMPTLVKDYRIFAISGGVERVIAEVEGNYQRVNRLNFEPVMADAVRIELLSTNGDERFGVYDLQIR